MREIKFDAIYKPTGEHFTPRSINFESRTTHGEFDGEVNDWCHFSLDGSNGDAILRQFTGLTDSRGNEIFEGDILKFNTDAPGVVDYFRGSWRVKTPPRYSGDDWRTSLWDATVDGYEIIGNIYENSDLLKGDEE